MDTNETKAPAFDLAAEAQASIDAMGPERLAERLRVTSEAIELRRVNNARTWLNDNRQVVEEFAELLRDLGIQVQLMDVIARELFGKAVSKDGIIPDEAVSTPVDMLRTAMNDLMNVGLFGDISFEFANTVPAAVSLNWLVRYARMLDPDIFPPDCIPDDSVVGACLLLFHHERKQGGAAIEVTES